MHHATQQARLYVNGVDVGAVTVKGWDGAWGLGEFAPDPAFSRIAPHFGLWSLLMHDDESEDRVSDAVMEELRRTERQIDALHAELVLSATGHRRPIIQVTIDGGTIEWVEVEPRHPPASGMLDSGHPV